MCHEISRAQIKDQQFNKWKVHSARFRSKQSMPAQSSPWSGRDGITMGGLAGRKSAERMIDAADCCFQSMRNASKSASTEQITKKLYINLSQSVHRQAWVQGFCGTLTRNSMWYSYEEDHILSGRASMVAMGVPTDKLPNSFSDNMFRDLSGDMYSVAIVQCIASALITEDPQGRTFG